MSITHLIITKNDVLTEEEVLRLFKVLRSDTSSEADKAESTELIFKSVYKLAISLVYKYLRAGIDIEDLAQCVFEGVMHAIKDFKPEFNTLFSTYCYYWARKYAIEGVHDLVKQVSITQRTGKRRGQISYVPFKEEHKPAINGYDAIYDKEELKIFEEEMAKLTEKEQDIIKARYFYRKHDPKGIALVLKYYPNMHAAWWIRGETVKKLKRAIKARI